MKLNSFVLNAGILFGLLVSLPQSALALRFEVTGYGPILSVEAPLEPEDTVASLTRKVLARAKGVGLIRDSSMTPAGVESITPIGQEPVRPFSQRISLTELRAYGWCYSVDGIAPDLLADEYHLLGHEARISWFFGFATFRNGNWETQCIPVTSP